MHATTASQETRSPLKKQLRIANPLKQSHLPEPPSPVTCRKKVVAGPKVHISNTKKEPVFKGRTSSEDYLSLTPFKGVQGSNSNSCTFTSNIKTIKKVNSFREEGVFLPSTANKNRHASKFGCASQEPTSGVKQIRVPLYGKRKATELDNKENEKKIGGERSLSQRDKQENTKAIKKLKTTIPEVKKKEIKHENMYLMDSTKSKMFCFSVFMEKDLGYSEFIQKTTKETDIDNDCMTDSDIMENVKHWTLEDLKEGIELQNEESLTQGSDKDTETEKTDESISQSVVSEDSNSLGQSQSLSEVRVEKGFCNNL